jgi:predicted ATPase with chaperone activity
LVARVRTVAFQGIEAVPVEAQVTIAAGLPAFTVVGLPDKAVGESRERVRAGKSMLAQRLAGLLPPLDPGEALEVSMIHSVPGLLREGKLMRQRPFRDPHHSASLPALVGGGLRAKPGEVSLAHLGVLFLDELPEFHGIR